MLVRGRWDMRRVLVGTTLIIAAFGAGSRAVKAAALRAPSCQAGSNKKWPVKYAGAKLELVITDQSARIKQGEMTALEISAASISEVGYDNSSHNPGWALLKDAGGLIVYGGEGIIVAPLLLAPAAILLPFKSTKHFVWISWEDKGNHSEAFLEVGKQDCRAVLDELQRLSGRPWVDMPKARKKLVSAMTTNADVTYVVEHGVETINAIQLPGKYLVLVSDPRPVRVFKRRAVSTAAPTISVAISSDRLEVANLG